VPAKLAPPDGWRRPPADNGLVPGLLREGRVTATSWLPWPGLAMAVPHPAATGESLLRAEHVHRLFHWFFFQLPKLPERALSADNYAFVDQARHFAGPYRFELVPNSSHFLQREQPQAVTKLVLD
jgi:pimeloyl-ACP methyl ester carboxylesterase